MQKNYYYLSPHRDRKVFLQTRVFLVILMLNLGSIFTSYSASISDIPGITKSVNMSDANAQQPQTKKITGTVYDEDGLPVPGAT